MKAAPLIFTSVRNLFQFHRYKLSFKNMIGSILAIALSLVPLIVVLEITNGMIEGITSRYLEIGSFHIQGKTYVNTDLNELKENAEIVKSLRNVKDAVCFAEGMGLCYSASSRSGVVIRAYEENIYLRDASFRKYIKMISGSFDLSQKSNALLSKELAKNLKVKAGDKIKILTAKTEVGKPMILRPSVFTVQGIFTTGYYDLDSVAVYIPLEAGMNVFKGRGSLGIGIKVSDPYAQLEPYAQEIREALPPGWQISTWFENEKPMYKSFQTTKILLLFIMMLILCVASVNISSSLIMIVLEKRPEIAILKSTGASPAFITASFMLTGLISGFIGAVIGITAGLLAAVNINEIISFFEYILSQGSSIFHQLAFPGAERIKIEILNSQYYLEEIPIKIKFIEIFMIFSFTIVMSLASAYFPARTASAVKPLEVIRKH